MARHNYDKAKNLLQKLPYGAELLIRLALGREQFAPLLEWYAATPSAMKGVAASGVATKLSEELGGDIHFWQDALPDILSGQMTFGATKSPQPLDSEETLERLLALKAVLRQIDAPVKDVVTQLRQRGVLIDLTLLSKLRNVTAESQKSTSKVSISEKRLDALLNAAQAIGQNVKADVVAAASVAPVTKQAPAQIEPAPAQPQEVVSAVTAPALASSPADPLPLQRLKVREMFERSTTGKVSAMEVAKALGVKNGAAAIAVLSEVRGVCHVGNQMYELRL